MLFSRVYMLNMEKLIKGLAVLLFTTLVVCSSSPAEDFGRNSGKFALKLYKTVIEDADWNLVISPVSIRTGLAYLYVGADGSTARELAEGLYLDADENVVAENHKSFLDHHAQSGAVKIANKIYLEKSFHILPQFAQLGASKFYSEVETLDTSDGNRAAQIVNSWIEQKTNNKIQNLLSADMVQNARSVIVNAIHFKADWVKAFKTHRTSTKPFWVSQSESMEVAMMHQTDYFSFAQFDGFKVIKLDFKGTDISFVVILPNDREGLRALEARFVEEVVNLPNFLSILKRTRVNLQLPKFKIESMASLEPTLAQMGMGTMFTDHANLSKLSREGVKIGSVIHKAVIEVDENGAEAAAATAILAVPSSLFIDNTPTIDFVADHPFLYMLVDLSGQVFFMGRFVN